jgi:hypothetical protein
MVGSVLPSPLYLVEGEGIIFDILKNANIQYDDCECYPEDCIDNKHQQACR